MLLNARSRNGSPRSACFCCRGRIRTVYLQLDKINGTVEPGLEAGYGIPQWIPILPTARQYVLEYLEARKVYLKSKGLAVNSWPLIPSIYNGKVKEHSSNNFRDIKEKIEERAQMDFKLKDFRSTCAQMIKDRNKGPTEIATNNSGIQAGHDISLLRTNQERHGQR